MNKKKKTGNMYEWVTTTRNFLGGECDHNCSYCYVKKSRFPIVKERYSGKLRLLVDEFKKPLGRNKTIFICDCNDMWADEVPRKFIEHILWFCNQYPENTYLFQTKNPKRFYEFPDRSYPPKFILGVTIETNRYYETGDAPNRKQRMVWMKGFKNQRKMVSLEPIINFDVKKLVKWMKEIKPEFVSIGADSKKSGLVEPPKKKIVKLIKELKKFTIVKEKDNLKRLMK